MTKLQTLERPFTGEFYPEEHATDKAAFFVSAELV